jgi:hypothetical protein
LLVSQGKSGRKEMISMPIRWDPKRVMEVADMMEKHINAAVEPLECAREVAKAALEIPNLPQYIGSRIRSIWSEIDRAIGDGKEDPGNLRKRLQAIRDEVPKTEFKAEKTRAAYGTTHRLI